MTILDLIKQFINQKKTVFLILAVDPIAVVMLGQDLSPEAVCDAARVIRYIAVNIIEGQTELDLITDALAYGWNLTHEGFIYCVQCALKQGLIIDSQIPLVIYQELSMATFNIASELAVEITRQLTGEPLVDFVSSWRSSISDFIKNHPIIVGCTIGGVIIFLVVIEVFSKEEPSKGELLDTPTILDTMKSPELLTASIDTITDASITPLVLGSILSFFVIGLILYPLCISMFTKRKRCN